MTSSKKFLLFALLFPIVILVGVGVQKHITVMYGEEAILPISGYDPRSLLSGHYLIYSIDYGVERGTLCTLKSTNYNMYICLDNKAATLEQPTACKKVIKGTCAYDHFVSGLERFYIPEDKANYLDDRVRNKAASIVVSVNPTGHSAVKDLLIDGKSWKQLR
jgi:uncharacterized membrane-anchored protein